MTQKKIVTDIVGGPSIDGLKKSLNHTDDWESRTSVKFSSPSGGIYQMYITHLEEESWSQVYFEAVSSTHGYIYVGEYNIIDRYGTLFYK